MPISRLRYCLPVVTWFLSLSIAVLGISFLPAFASHPNVDWDELNLNSQQTQQINQVEAQWKTTAGQILPQLNEDRAELKQLLNTPNGDQRRIMELQNRVNVNKNRLHNAAMQSFLRKKEYLNSQQQQQLQQMLGPSFR